MLEGQDIVYVGNDWFTENKTSSHHIAEILAKKNRVLYVEGAGQRRPNASGRDLRKINKKLRKIFAGTININKNMRVISPIIIPFHEFKIIRKLNAFLQTSFVKMHCSSWGIKSPILWILVPHYHSIIGCLKEIMVVYYIVDQYSAQPNVDVNAIIQMEDKILTSADIVFAVSQTLVDDKKRKRPDIHLSLHGVDVSHFRKAAQFDIEIAQDIKKINRPIAGFFGLIEEWIDFELIEHLAVYEPKVSFVFIGRIVQKVAKLRKYPNIYFLGPRPYEVLPSYLKAFDVCLLPYKLNRQVINSNPKKLREYLAAGKPVVSVKVKEVERHSDLVYIANSYEDFKNKVIIAINEKDNQLREKRMQRMEKDSWDVCVHLVCERIIEETKFNEDLGLLDQVL